MRAAARIPHMNTPLRTLTCALAVASAVAAAPAAANPGMQQVRGGPGASATLRGGVLTMHWQGGSSRIHVPAGYALPVVTTRGELGGMSFNGRTVVLADRGGAGDGRSRFLVAEYGKVTPLTFRGRVAFDAIAPSGSAIYLTRHTSPTDPTRYVVLQYARGERKLDQIGVKSVFSAQGAESPDWKMQGLPVARATAADGTWTYTLYTAREYPFIHALPLGQGPWAVCIELPESWRARVATLSLRARPGQVVEVLNPSGTVVATADVMHGKLQLAAGT
ncbi:MAG: hypothetical protein QOK36_199 [Gaiellales bacterium]|nr:hypothetical protein [Gaiellales bacterium]